MNEYQLMQDAWQMINNYAALCATENISEENRKKANDEIAQLLSTLSPVMQKIRAKASGLVT